MGLRLELSAAWGAATAPRVSFGFLFGSDCLAQGATPNWARTWIPDLGMGDPGCPVPSQIGLGLFAPLFTLVSSALIQERDGGNLYIYLGGLSILFHSMSWTPGSGWGALYGRGWTMSGG